MTPTDAKLLPCPFCGKPPLIVCPDNSYSSAMVTCGDANECPVDLTAWGDLDAGETVEDAKRAWNTRARDPDELREALAAARPYVEVVARGEGTMPEIVCAEATLDAIDTALSRNRGDVGHD